MTPQQIVGLAVRLFAIWLVVIAFQIFGIASALNSQLKPGGAFAFYFMPALPLLLAIFLWFFPMFVAHKLVPRTHDQNTLKVPARELTAAASAIIGLWVCIASLPQIVATFGIVIYGGGFAVMSAYFTPERTTQIFAVLLQSIASIVLLTRPWWVATLVFPGAKESSHEQPQVDGGQTTV